jgi:hypothetical protein
MKKTVFFLMVLFPSFMYGQEFDLLDFIEGHHQKIQDSLLTEMAFDSLANEIAQLDESSISWDAAEFRKSKDNHLKIFQFKGEGCSAYCNPMYQYIVARFDSLNNQYSFHAIDNSIAYDIDSIIELSVPNMYLIFGNHNGRPRGIEGVWGESVSLCKIDSGFQIKWSFSASTSTLVTHDSAISQLVYIPQDQKILFTYDWYNELENFKTYRVTGLWIFNGTTFIKSNEEIKYGK